MKPCSVSLILLSYNQEAYVADAVNSVLAQEFENLQIIVSDDCSSDRSYDILSGIVEKYSGPHEIIVRQNGANLGILSHLKIALSHCTGDLIILTAGDDLSHANRVATLVDRWKASGGGPAMLYSEYRAIGPADEPLDETRNPIYSGPHQIEQMADGVLQVLGATSAITRDLVDRFAPINPSVKYEDRVFPFRALLLGGKIIFVDEPLVDYRLHVGVSQQRARDALHYLKEHSRRDEQARLADAAQRLLDLISITLTDRDLRRRCERTILTHEARIASTFATGLTHEVVFLDNMLSGAGKITALKLYLKYRFLFIFRYFIRI